MKNLNFDNILVVGIDTHKTCHTAVLVTPFCQVIETYELDNSIEKINAFLDDVLEKAFGKTIYFALEDVNCYGYHLSRAILSRGQKVFNVPAVYTERDRKHTSHIDKSDALDAQGVARVLLTKSDSIPPEFMVSEKSELALKLKKMIADRKELMRQNTALKNQLHNILHEIYGDNYRGESTYSKIFCPMALKEWISKPEKREDYTSRRALVKFKSLQFIYEEIKILDKQLQEKSNDDIKLLESIPGCSNQIASAIIAEIGDITRFRSQSALAKYTGLAPREHSSGKSIRHFVDRRGNRRLNNAIHRLAFCQLGNRCKATGRWYFVKKIKEGKSKLSALRCLKRKMIDIVYQILTKKEKYKFNYSKCKDLNLNIKIPA